MNAPPANSSSLRGWSAIAKFLGLPNPTIHRWAKQGMPVQREGRGVVAKPEELNEWLQKTSGGVHVVSAGADLLKDLRASLATQNTAQRSLRGSDREGVKRRAEKSRKRATRS